MSSGEEIQDHIVHNKEIGFGNSEIPVEDFDKLALDPADVTLAEGAGDHCPMNILQGGVIGVL